MRIDPGALDVKVREAVASFWRTRDAQVSRQARRGKADRGARGAVTGGAQMDGFLSLLANLARGAGAPDATIHRRERLELPGFFRPTKEWDMLVAADGRLLVALEAKSQVGPSFGNNFNNRTEEAIGSALDLWTAYRQGAFRGSPRPWLGYVFLLEDCPRFRSPVAVKEPHFPVFEEFRGASYARGTSCSAASSFSSGTTTPLPCSSHRARTGRGASTPSPPPTCSSRTWRVPLWPTWRGTL